MSADLPKTPLRFIAHFVKPYTGYMLIYVLCMFVAGLHGVVYSYLTKVIIDTLNVTDSANVVHAVMWPAIFFVLTYELRNLSWRGVNYVNLKTQAPIKENIIKRTFSYVHQQPYQYFHDTFAGTISSNISILVDSIESVVHQKSVQILRGIFLLGASLISMYFVNILFFIALAVWLFIFISINTVLSRKIKIYSDEYAQSQSAVSGRIVDSITNAQNVRIFAANRYEGQYLEQFLSAMKNRFQRKEKYFLKVYLWQGMSVTLLIATMLSLLIYLKTKNLVTIGDFALILALTIYVTDHSWWLTEQFNHFNDFYGKCTQSLQALFKPLEIKDKVEAAQLQVSYGKIVFDKVEFHYKGTDALFSDKSVTIPPGQKVGLVGYSGGGKSTFINLIMRLYDVQRGNIYIDDQNIKDVTQESLHRAISLIPQDPSLFHRSLLENILYGKLDATEEEIIVAAMKSHANEFIQQLPQGYESQVGDRGVKLSGGQRQRIAIARAFLKNSPILILDEATSQLDSVTEQYIQESLWTLMQGKTAIVVAHRLSTLLHMDRILVFDKGKIIEDGNHAELLAAGGLYKTLWEAQVGGFIQDMPEEESL